jgi:hypothetical protein
LTRPRPSTKRSRITAVVVLVASLSGWIFALVLHILGGGAVPAAGFDPRPEGTRRMVERLEDLAETANFHTNSLLNTQRVDLYRSLEPPRDPSQRLGFEFQLARELLHDGRSEEAVERFRQLWSLVDREPSLRGTPIAREVHSLLALSHLRLGEQENCVALHGVDSCLLPIRGSGIHKVQRGSRAAIQEYAQILARHPDDLTSRWLINVAYMTLGEYPDKVPPQWLIPPRAFESDYDIKRFYNIAPRLGLDVLGQAGGAIMEDFDGDHQHDLMVSSLGFHDQLRYFRSNGDGTFTERTKEAGLEGIVGGLNIVQTDYNNDGHMDVFVARGAWLRENGRIPNSLLRSNGDGTFEDVTDAAGLLSFHPTQAVAWGDYNNDGWVDLFIANESADGEPRHPCELFRSNGDGTFTEEAATAGVAATGYFKGAAWGDYDNDGLLDIYVTGLAATPRNVLFRNNGRGPDGRWTFTDVADRAGVREPKYSFPTWFFDYDNDGWLDIFVSGYQAEAGDVAADYLGLPNTGEKPRLYRNQRDGTFKDASKEARVDKVLLTMGCNFGDLDNDGWLDFYVGTGDPDYRSIVPNRMFRNAEGKFFQDVTTSGGFGHLQKGHGIAFGDLDNDGDQDVFAELGGAYTGDRFRSALFENPGHGNNWLKLKLVGVKSNRGAIGARVKVTVDGHAGPRDIHVTVTSGSSFGASSLLREIGLGKAMRVREVRIAWPSGLVQTLSDLRVNQFLVVREGDSRTEEITLPRVDLSPGS